MSRTTAIAATVFAVAMTTFGYAARDEQKAAVLLKAAEVKEVIEGDPKGAIPLYAQAAEEAGSNRVLAAKALYGLGEAYRKTGSPAARETFTRIVRDFSEPRDVVMAARARLAASTPRQTHGERTERLVLAADRGSFAGVSADGTVAVGLTETVLTAGAVRPQLTIWNLLSGESRVLVPNSASGGMAALPVIAPDGRSVAYRWTETTEGKSVVSLRVIGTEPGAAVRVLPSPAGATMVGPLAWSPDGGSLLVGSEGLRFLDWLTLANGTYRRVKSFEPWQRPGRLAVGPDGLIAYSAVPRQGSEDIHIFVIDSTGQEAAVVNAAGRSTDPLWTPDGEHLLFVSDRSGSQALWSVGVRGGRPTGDPERMPVPLTGSPLAVTRSGQLYYQTSNMSDSNQVAFVGDLEPGGARITKTFVGEGLSWSPDGKFLAYIRNTAAPVAVMIRNVETGEERAYPKPLLGLPQALWLPDGSGVVVFVRDFSSVPGGAIHSLDLRTGEFKRLVAFRQGQGRSSVVAVSPDGKALYVSEVGTGTRRVLCMDIATGAERVVGTFENGGQGAPGMSISPDGNSLVLQAWADQAKRLARLLVVRTDGSGTKELLGPFPADRTLSILKWTRDGRFIYYVTTAENGDWRLMRISPNGGTPEFAGVDSRKLSGTIRIPALIPWSPLSMDISPNGAQIVFGHRPAMHSELWVRDDLLALMAPRQ